MKRSRDRILTTHVGRLQRPDELTRLMDTHPRKRPDDEAFAALLRDSVRDVVKRQVDHGVDIVTDGEFGKLSWHSYLLARLEGFEPKPSPTGRPSDAAVRDRRDFAEYYAELDRGVTYYGNAGGDLPKGMRWVCTGPVRYVGQRAARDDVGNLKHAAAQANAEEAFMPATAPLSRGGNEHYPDRNALLYAIGDAMREEYRAIVDAGLVLQIDDPRLPAEWDSQFPAPTLAEYRRHAEAHVEMVNHALQGIPEDRVRYHICWGSWHGPHTHDIPLKDVVDILLKVKAQAYVFEAANARHEHEWRVWKDVKLPDGKILVPGVVSHATNVVEHPELVAWRIGLYADIVGRENVIAGTDCGLGYRVHPQVAWAKLAALSEGARLASAQLWGRQAGAR